MDDEAVSSGASFTDVAHLGAHCAFDGLVNVGVFKDNKWCVAAELHGGAQNVICSSLEQRLAHWGRTGERYLAQTGVCHDWAGDCRCRVAADNVENACWQTSIDHRLSEVLRGQWGELCSLQYHGAASRYSWSNLARCHCQWEVPWSNQQAWTNWLAAGNHVEGAFRSWEGTAVITDCFLSEPAQEFAAVGDLAAGFSQRLAHFQGHQGGEGFRALLNQVESAGQNCGALTWRSCRPLVLNCTSCIQRSHCIRFTCRSKRCNNFTGRRVFHIKGCAVLCVNPLAIN